MGLFLGMRDTFQVGAKCETQIQVPLLGVKSQESESLKQLPLRVPYQG